MVRKPALFHFSFLAALLDLMVTQTMSSWESKGRGVNKAWEKSRKMNSGNRNILSIEKVDVIATSDVAKQWNRKRTVN